MFIPGRIEVLGKHTDYCGGRSIVCAIDRGFHAEVEPRSDSLVVLENRNSGEAVSFDLNHPVAPPGHWLNYAVEVGRRLTANFVECEMRGVSISFRSDLPKAAGLSSSSALVIMVCAALDRVNNLRSGIEFRANITNDLELAEYVGCIENGRNYRSLVRSSGVGTFGGSQDHAAILLGRHGALSLFSFSPLAHKAEFDFPSDLAFVVASSGVEAQKTGSALEQYNRLSRMASEISDPFGGGRSLAQIIDEFGFDILRETIKKGKFGFSADELLDRAEQFRVENYEIIPEVCDRLAAGKIYEIGDLVDRSQHNAERLLGNQIEETVFLQRSARELGAFAASAFGAGFGGSVYAIVKADTAFEFTNEWSQRFHERFPQHCEASEFFKTKPSQASI